MREKPPTLGENAKRQAAHFVTDSQLISGLSQLQDAFLRDYLFGEEENKLANLKYSFKKCVVKLPGT